MSKRVISSNPKDQDETKLSDECLQYLQSIDAADKFSNAPNSIDQTAWNHLCRMRRSKIETEFKVNCIDSNSIEKELIFFSFK